MGGHGRQPVGCFKLLRVSRRFGSSSAASSAWLIFVWFSNNGRLAVGGTAAPTRLSQEKMLSDMPRVTLASRWMITTLGFAHTAPRRPAPPP
jgi:hypothetical protein